MRRTLSIIASAIVGVLGLLQIWTGLVQIFPSLVADGQLSAAASDAIKAASDFNALAKDSYLTGTAPRQTDAAAKPLLDKVFATSVIASKKLSKSDLSAMGEWSKAVATAGIVYIFAGTGISDISKATNDPRVIEKVDQNVVSYAPEMGRYFDAQLAVTGGAIDAVNARFSDSTPATAKQGSGMADVRGGLVTTLTSTLSTLVTEGLTDDWRRKRLPALDAIAPKAAKLLLPDQCRTVRDTALEVAQVLRDPITQAGLKAFGGSLGCQS